MRSSGPVQSHVRPDPERRSRHCDSCLAASVVPSRGAVEEVLVLSGLVGPLFQLENHAVGLQGHQGVELIFCNLDALGGPLGAEMELLLDVALTFEQQQSDGALQHHETFEACDGAVAPVAVGPHVGAGLQHVEESLNRILFPVEIVAQAQAGVLPGLGGNLGEQLLVDAAKGRGLHPFCSAADR